MTNIFFDIETDSLDPTIIHCVVFKYVNYSPPSPGPEVRVCLSAKALTDFLWSRFSLKCDGDFTTDKFIGHNILGFDLPTLQKLWGINYCIEPDRFGNRPVKFIDTLVWSRYLDPDRPGGHSLESWGERLGHPKMEHKDFATYTPEMLEYCKNDVLLTEKVYNHLLIINEMGIAQ